MCKNLYLSLFALLAAALVLSACGSTVTPTPQTVVQVQTQIVEVTPTPGPATATPLPAGSVTITAGGATFPQPLYSQWTYAFQYVDPSAVINYTGVGSGAGITGIINDTFDFAGSDAIPTAQNYSDGKDLQLYPMVAGAVVPVYNIAFKPVPTPAAGATAVKLPALILSRQALVDIYNGKVTMWNDPEIVSLNPGLANYLPSARITTIHRSDASGTTQNFTKALAAFSPDWQAGAASSIQWPIKNSLGGKGNPGVAALVLATPNSIGYVELAYAISNSLSYASMVNKAGNLVVASGASVNSAMADFSTAFDNNPQLTATIIDAPGANSWPISAYTYIILHTSSMTDCVKAAKILEYLQWSVTDPGAAKMATQLGYSVLPSNVQAKVLTALKAVTCKGQPVLH
jgi:phosphate ABC transporter phosphate-binding protein